MRNVERHVGDRRFAQRKSSLKKNDGVAGLGSRRLRPWFLLGIVLCTSWLGCRQEDRSVQAPPDVRDVRVLLFGSADGCRVRVDGPYRLHTSEGQPLSEGRLLQWMDVRVGSGLCVGDLPPVDGPVVLEAEHDGTIQLAAKRDGKYLPSRQYAGSLTFVPRADGSLRAINRLDVESYVAGVVSHEVWPEFHDEALKGQAIASRSYVLYLMAGSTRKPFDVRASEGDQVYGGIRRDDFGKRVRRAVDVTRGMVLCWKTPSGYRAFCTYYSAACGGMSQSISDVQPGQAPGPLCGGVHCDFCKIAKGNAYRWGPVEISKRKMLAKLRSRYRRLNKWARIDSVVVLCPKPILMSRTVKGSTLIPILIKLVC